MHQKHAERKILVCRKHQECWRVILVPSS